MIDPTIWKIISVLSKINRRSTNDQSTADSLLIKRTKITTTMINSQWTAT